MPYTDFNWITDRIAVGALVSEHEAFPFDAILSMATEAPPTVRDIVQSGAVDYQWLSIVDGYSWEEHDEIVRRYDTAAAQIAEWHGAGKRVLVHCIAGVSRSATAVVWYLVRYEGYDWDEAVALLRASRPQVNPNIRFEIPLRMALGEELTEEWIERRIAEHCNWVEETTGVQLDPAELKADLERQGTLRRVKTAVG